MIIGKPAPFVRAFIEAVDAAIRAHQPHHAMSVTQRTWLAFCVTAVLGCSPANTLKIEKPTLQLGLHMNNPTEGLAYEETPRLGPTVPQPRLLPVQSYA
jgi:hypothetical protein